jgi:hypothetical protein
VSKLLLYALSVGHRRHKDTGYTRRLRETQRLRRTKRLRKLRIFTRLRTFTRFRRATGRETSHVQKKAHRLSQRKAFQLSKEHDLIATAARGETVVMPEAVLSLKE